MLQFMYYHIAFYSTLMHHTVFNKQKKDANLGGISTDGQITYRPGCFLLSGEFAHLECLDDQRNKTTVNN